MKEIIVPFLKKINSLFPFFAGKKYIIMNMYILCWKCMQKGALDYQYRIISFTFTFKCNQHRKIPIYKDDD